MGQLPEVPRAVVVVRGRRVLRPHVDAVPVSFKPRIVYRLHFASTSSANRMAFSALLMVDCVSSRRERCVDRKRKLSGLRVADVVFDSFQTGFAAGFAPIAINPPWWRAIAD